MDHKQMDKKSKILLWIFFVSIFISVYMTFERTVIDHDYPVTEEVQ